MTLLAALLLFLLAFAGLALGVIMKRRSLRSGCGSSHGKNCCQENASPADCHHKKQGSEPS